MHSINFFRRWLAFILISISLIMVWYYDLGQYLNFTSLKQHRQALLALTHEHYNSTVAIFMLIYILTVTLSIPGSIFLSMTSGFLFGIVGGSIVAILSATLGATFLFLSIRIALEPWMAKKNNPWIVKMRKNLQEGAVSYLFMMRLIPLFPFWMVNIACALMGIRISIFIFTTLFGIIPNIVVHVFLGRALGHIFDQNKVPDIHIIFEPAIFFPLMALTLLAGLPIIYKIVRKKSSFN